MYTPESRRSKSHTTQFPKRFIKSINGASRKFCSCHVFHSGLHAGSSWIGLDLNHKTFFRFYYDSKKTFFRFCFLTIIILHDKICCPIKRIVLISHIREYDYGELSVPTSSMDHGCSCIVWEWKLTRFSQNEIKLRTVFVLIQYFTHQKVWQHT